MRQEIRRRVSWSVQGLVPLVLVAMTACTAPAGSTSREAAASASVVPEAWEHERSDIPVDPRIRFGSLDNGLRWAWAHNPEPKERCYLRMHVDVGSLSEREDEQGLAHFLEHMAFNGSENFEAGTLIEWFQEHGMSFGADTNATTSFSETVYKLDLPTSDEETLREGLLVLRDFASRLTLAPDEIDNEKGVIDGEQRERDSAGFRAFIKQIDTVFAGTRYPERIPIGIKEVRDRFDAELVRGFYERWYRPENITLVAVGDLPEAEQALLPALFEEYFGDMPNPAAPVVSEPDVGTPDRLAHAFGIYEEEIPSVRLVVERLKPYEEDPVTIAEWVEDVPLEYARSMLNLRFRELAKKPEAPFLGAGVGSASALEVIDGERLQVACAPDKWEEALAFCEKELRRALLFGFQQAELDEVVADARRGLDEAVEREPKAHSSVLLRRILTAAEDPYVPTNAEATRAILTPALDALTVEACGAALRKAWSEGELTIHATGNLDLGDDAGERLLAAYAESARQPVEAGEEIVVGEFAYASDPSQAGTIVERRKVRDLDFHTARFANGVTLNVKATDFKEKQILVAANFGEGRLTLENERAVLEWVGGQVFNGGGLEAHSEDELRRLAAGKQVGAAFSIGLDAFSLSGSTTSEDLLRECELICAYLTAPGWREDGLVELRRVIPLYFDGLKHQHRGPMVTEFMPALFGNDPRFGHPTQEEASTCELGAIRSWLEPHLADAPIEISIVGDLDVEETIRVAAQTFGALPKRRAWRDYDERRKAPRPASGIQQTHRIETQIPKSLVMIVFPATDGLDPARRRRFNVLETVLNDRLRIEVREKLGAAYSPGAGVDVSQVYPGVGMVAIQAMSDPDKVDTLVEACLEVADSLARDGVTEEEANRLREPILNQLRDSKRRNGYWMGVLSEAQRRPESLNETRTLDAFYRGYTAEEITPLAARYLGREKASVLVVHPRGSDG